MVILKANPKIHTANFRSLIVFAVIARSRHGRVRDLPEGGWEIMQLMLPIIIVIIIRPILNDLRSSRHGQLSVAVAAAVHCLLRSTLKLFFHSPLFVFIVMPSTQYTFNHSARRFQLRVSKSLLLSSISTPTSAWRWSVCDYQIYIKCNLFILAICYWSSCSSSSAT